MANSDRVKFRLVIFLASIFFGISFLINYIHDLINSGWDFSAISFNQFTLYLPLLVFAGALLARILMDRMSNTMEKITDTVEQLPQKIREDTNAEIEILRIDNDKFRDQIAKGVVYHDQYCYRTLTYKRELGTLFNGFGDSKDLSRNVLFSNKTINLIFFQIRNIDINNDKVLRDIGKASSERFATEMVKDIRKKSINKETNLESWIKDWIEFDSDAGFGKFVYEELKSNGKTAHRILLKYSFLAQDYIDGEKNKVGLCDFITGYLEGILNAFPNGILEPHGLQRGNILVTHNIADEHECICAGRAEHDGCVFNLYAKE